MEWFCIINGQQRGPMSLDDLTASIRSGALKADDYVWTTSFGNQWKRVHDVAELNETTPPPAPSATQTTAEPVTPTTLPDTPGGRPSVSTAISTAWEIMVKMLFKPFDLGLWFSIGFCAWLAYLNMGGFNYHRNSLAHLERTSSLPNLIKEMFHASCAKLAADFYMMPVLMGTILLVGLVIGLVFAWLQARGAFMFLHRWHYPRATIAESWECSRSLWGSLFLFRLIAGLFVLLLFALVLVGAYVSIPLHCASVVEFIQSLPRWLSSGGNLTLLLWLSCWIFALLTVMTLWWTMEFMLNHFVTPIMYRKRIHVMQAWKPVLALCNEHAWPMVIYLLLVPLLVLACFVVFFLAGCLTCCTVLALLCIPYINAVVLLPLYVFIRGIGICFLHQWRPELMRPNDGMGSASSLSDEEWHQRLPVDFRRDR